MRTGKFAADYHRDAAAFFAAQPGVGPDAAIWLHEQGMALLGSDTSGTEAIPFPDPERTTHRAMLVERGVHLVEIMDLEAIVAAGVRTCQPPSGRGPIDRAGESVKTAAPLPIAARARPRAKASGLIWPPLRLSQAPQ